MGQTTETAMASVIREKYCVLIPHPEELMALVVPARGGWALPEFCPEREWPDLREALRAIRAQLRLDASILYDLRRYEAAIPGPLNIFVLEGGTAPWHPSPEGRWIGVEGLPDLAMPFPQQRRVLQAWLAEAAGTLLPLRKLYAAIHQGRLIEAYQQRLGGQDYLPETPTGNSFQHLQCWFAQKLLALSRMELG